MVTHNALNLLFRDGRQGLKGLVSVFREPSGNVTEMTFCSYYHANILVSRLIDVEEFGGS
jgi:hypothetical protein